MTAADRARREHVRLLAADLFADGMSPPAVADGLRVSRKSAYSWHQTWESGGRDALRSAGPASRCRLDDDQLGRLVPCDMIVSLRRALVSVTFRGNAARSVAVAQGNRCW
ncbi:helix-turn-helix domain-containing protein [Frankia sp. Cppng1_Ct_nod]|uniref:helix-turn-helix domain-containing protein n=1 Tax=Frankia sp. Cppng1_Ct_nod TaxID=2897162 RepID=UPI0020246C8D|nr:helix-turn-helix domain-containing protein [Frankia sp. Cppng1_Ct_nod]